MKVKNREIKINKIKSKEKPKKPYTLKPALKVECMDCGGRITVLFCPPRQCYSHKNDWE